MKSNRPSQPKNSTQAWKYPRARIRIGGAASQENGNRLNQFELAIGSPEPGEVLAQRFEIQEQIAVGGMSLIYRAFDQTRQHPVALKFLSPALLQTPAAIEAFRREAQVSMRLSHPNILRVFDVQSYHKSSFLVMELLEGGNLRQWLSRQEGENSLDSLEEKCRILLELCQGLQSAHQITAHCDLKPENVGITAKGEVKIMDFGLARLIHRYESRLSRETVTQLNGGTPYYIAPEQLRTQASGTPLSDQFSFGVIAYELISGELPIGFSQSLADRELLPSRRFNQAIDRSLATCPDDRFPDMRTLQKELELGLKSSPGPWSRFRASWQRKSNTIKTAGTVALTCLALSFPIESWRRHVADTQEQVEAGWRQFDETLKTAAHLAESAHQRRRTLSILQEQFNRHSTITNRSTSEKINLTTISNDLNKARIIWSWLKPQLSSEESFVILEESLSDIRQALRDNSLDQFRQGQARFNEHAQRLTDAISTIPQTLSLRQEWEQHRVELDQLDMEDSLPQRWQSSEASARESISTTNWALALKQWDSLVKTTRSNLEKRALEAEQRFNGEKERWQTLFGELGPPDLRFLADPFSQADEASGRANQGQYPQAIERFTTAAETIKEWSDEVTRHEQVLDAAQVTGVTYLRALGMRFAQAYNGPVYWGVTEVRVMDFARWATEGNGISPITATNWIAPGFIQGPTDPAVWIKREDAAQFSAWVAGKLIQEITAKGYGWESPLARLPLIDHLERYNEETGDRPVRFAIYPSIHEWESNHFQEAYVDQRIKPNAFLGPADRGEPSPHGIFGLHNGIWEWTNSYQDFRDRGWDGVPLKWILAGGDEFGVSNFNGYDPPRTENYVHVMRKDAIGLRLTINPGPNFDPKSLQ